MTFQELFLKLHEHPNLKPDLLKDKAGNNFRAISESAILEALNPLLDHEGFLYEVEIKDYKLETKEVWMNNVKALRFIATCTVTLHFKDKYGLNIYSSEGVGMGIDSGDKAIGKAFTYAVKYALLKFFRLRYSDDPDATPSELLTTEVKPVTAEKTKVAAKKKEVPMTESQRDYILGMMTQKQIPEAEIIGKFKVEPSKDPAEEIPQRLAREIIEWLKDHEDLSDTDLPF